MSDDAKKIRNWLGDGYTVLLAEPPPRPVGDPLDPITRYTVRHLDGHKTLTIKSRVDLDRGMTEVAIEGDGDWFDFGSTVEPGEGVDSHEIPELRAAIRARLK